jgi:hypothetical protein
MKVLDPGHVFELGVLDAESAEYEPPPLLKFVKRVGAKYPGNATPYSGTTTQEVLRACISRAIYVDTQTSCWQTRVGMWLMCIVVWLFEHRAAKRHGRVPPTLHEAVWGHPCQVCGHVGCWGGCRERNTQTTS